MLRVPGTDMDLFQVKGAGGDVRVVYSPLDAVELAAKNPGKQVVFFGVGFETTAPANAMSVHVAKRRGLKNFSVLVSHVLVPPAIAAILESPGNKVQAFLLAGHVCSVMGYWEYPPLAEKYKIPLVVTGFEPLDLLDGIRRAVMQLEAGKHEVENAYERIVNFAGNKPAQKLLAEVFEVTDRAWRGIGVIPKSGWRLSDAYREFDAEERFHITGIHTVESPLCRAGDVLRGAIKPAECSAFGRECTPRHPLGATMVSSEGACAAYFNYGRFLSAEDLAGAGAGLSAPALSGAAHG
jgi:hydrogenase expression/formation protein HypD